MPNLSEPVLSVVFSNLAKAAEKQKLPEEARMYSELSTEYWKPGKDGAVGGWDGILSSVETDLAQAYPAVSAVAARLWWIAGELIWTLFSFIWNGFEGVGKGNIQKLP